MKPLRLFTAFHANLDFSALPEADRPLVLARCYWPLLSLPEQLGIPIGLEMSTRTLETLQSEDPDWVKRFLRLTESGLIEPIGSGRAQIVGPLVPSEINRLNLRLGADRYASILGASPRTWLVNEQTWSDGLASLYADVGAERLVMEWNNPAARRKELRPLRCRTARVRAANGSGPVLLWNDSIVFQKVQRVAHGEIPEDDLRSYVERLGSRSGAVALCLYGGDVEIFDYRPSRRLIGGDEGTEMARLLGLFERLAADDGYAFVLPRDVPPPNEESEPVALGSAEDPIPCKKQPRYNPTRWAVSGRDGLGMNTRCEALLRSESERGERQQQPVASHARQHEPTCSVGGGARPWGHLGRGPGLEGGGGDDAPSGDRVTRLVAQPSAEGGCGGVKDDGPRTRLQGRPCGELARLEPGLGEHYRLAEATPRVDQAEAAVLVRRR
ncbi:MAG: hypothetical protein AAGC67_03325, partial [Myxococcota bacterium]